MRIANAAAVMKKADDPCSTVNRPQSVICKILDDKQTEFWLEKWEKEFYITILFRSVHKNNLYKYVPRTILLFYKHLSFFSLFKCIFKM
jgi:hypothetical protein